MRHLGLTDRMNKIIALADNVDCIADIGSDHGKVAAALINTNIAKNVIAVDISSASLEKTRQLAKKMHIIDRVSCRIGSGLAPIVKNEAQAIIIAGMGASLIIDILSADYNKVLSLEYLLLAPNNQPEKIREFLSNDFIIIDEDISYDANHFYIIIKAIPGNEIQYSDTELLLGKHLLKKNPPGYKDYIAHKLNMAQYKKEMLKNAGYDATKEEWMEKKYKEVLKCL